MAAGASERFRRVSRRLNGFFAIGADSDVGDGRTRPPKTEGRSLTRRATLTTLGGAGVGLLAGFGVSASSGSTEIADWDGLASLDGGSGEYELVATLDQDTAGYGAQVDTPAGGWDPIDNFDGTLDGQGHAINDLEIDRPGENRVGLFGDGMDGDIHDLAITEATITGQERVGVVAGFNNGQIKRVLASGTVTTGDRYGGGLVGDNGALMEDVASFVEVTGGEYLGGLTGENYGGTIRRSYAAGPVDGDSNLGGLVGMDVGTLDGVYWDIGVTGQDEAVGFPGDPTSGIQGYGTVGDDDPIEEMQGTDPLPTADDGDGTMDQLDFDTTWVAVIEDEAINPVPLSDGYPILTSVDTETQLEAQGVDWDNPSGGIGTLIIRDSTFENNSVGIEIGGDE